jgi:hypothetical protein
MPDHDGVAWADSSPKRKQGFVNVWTGMQIPTVLDGVDSGDIKVYIKILALQTLFWRRLDVAENFRGHDHDRGAVADVHGRCPGQ